MKRFLLHLTFFILLIVGMLSLVTWFTDKKLQARNKGRMQVWHSIANGSINANMLVMGSSHAHVQVNPAILATAFPGWSVYNLGIDGYNFDMQLAQYRFYRRHNKAPRLLLLCVDYFEFDKSRWEIDRAQFLPYMYDTSISSALLSIGLNPVTRLLPFLKYRGEANAVVAAITGKSPLPQDIERPSWAGYAPRQDHWDETAFNRIILNRVESRPEFNKQVWTAFQSFLEECSHDSIPVCLVFTPHEYRFTQHIEGGTEYRHHIAQDIEGKAMFIDFSNGALSHDTSLFYSTTHLNSKGADLFTGAIADSLKNRYGPELSNLQRQ